MLNCSNVSAWIESAVVQSLRRVNSWIYVITMIKSISDNFGEDNFLSKVKRIRQLQFSKEQKKL